MTESYEQWVARCLSFHQWEFLADHFQGPRAILPNEAPTRVALANRKLIRVEPHGKPTRTVITKKGHAVMCAAMGMMADMLVAMEHESDRKLMEKWGYGRRTTAETDSPDGKLSLQTTHQS